MFKNTFKQQRIQHDIRSLYTPMMFQGKVGPKIENSVIIYSPPCLWKVCSPQNISGASQQNSIAAFSLTTEVEGDFSKSFSMSIDNTVMSV